MLTDHSATLPEKLEVAFEHDSNSANGRGRAEDVFVEDLVRWLDEDANEYRRVTLKGRVQWITEDGTLVPPAGARELKIEHSVPAPFDEVAGAVLGNQPVFKALRSEPPDWRLDRDAAAETVAEFSHSEDVKLRCAAASHPQLPAEEVKRLVRDAEAAVRASIAHHPELEAADAAVLAKDRVAEVRRQIAASAHAEAHLAALVQDDSAEVRRACASHPALTDEMRRTLLADEDRAVRARALNYLPVTAAWVQELRSAKDEKLVAWAMDHEGEVAGKGAEMAPGDWKKDLMDPRVAVREAVLRKVAPARLIPYLEGQRERILQDESARLRMALAGSTRDAGTLERLARDADADVRRTALQNLMVPARVLLAEAEQLAKAPASRWSTSDPDYMDHMSAVEELLKHPRLPAEALTVIHRAYPRRYRLEPQRNMPLLVVLERAQDNSPSLEFDAAFSAWKKVAQDPKGDHATVFAAMLSCEDEYLKSAARMNATTPVVALLAHVRKLEDDTYALEEVAKNALLGAAGGEGAELRRRLMALKQSGVDEALAHNPDMPVEALKELRERAPQAAMVTLWQAWGQMGVE